MPKNKYLKGSLFTKTVLTVGETTISKQIEDYLDRRNIYNLRLNSGMAKRGNYFIHLCPEGTPDRYVLYKGVTLFIEVKRPGEKPTDIQTQTHQRIYESGGNCIIATRLDDVINALKEIDQIKQ